MALRLLLQLFQGRREERQAPLLELEQEEIHLAAPRLGISREGFP